MSLSAVHDDYEALSYVWGDPLIRENIELDGVEFQVTTNLHAALRHLRWVTRPRLLWIDAVCINQTNPAERSKQVSLMTEIYKHAKQVIIWLGESSHDSLTECVGTGPFRKVHSAKVHSAFESWHDSRVVIYMEQS
jgi:Heterokaryon incompatibility protein (HET)